MSSCVYLLSGGMDSAVLLGTTLGEMDKGKCWAVGFDYGQKHKVENTFAALVAKYYGLPFELIKVPPEIFQGAGSTLIDKNAPIEKIGTYAEYQDRYGGQPTVVPNRNMVMIALAASFAWSKGCDQVGIAAHAGDAGNWHYPDCTPHFLGTLGEALEIGTENRVGLLTPFVHYTKAQLVTRGATFGVPLNMTLSCYHGSIPACGTCSTCLERLDAFKTAGFIDPISYAVNLDWDNCIPYPTSNPLFQYPQQYRFPSEGWD